MDVRPILPADAPPRFTKVMAPNEGYGGPKTLHFHEYLSTVAPLNFMERVTRISSSIQHRDYNRISICMSALDVMEVSFAYLRNI